MKAVILRLFFLNIEKFILIQKMMHIQLMLEFYSLIYLTFCESIKSFETQLCFKIIDQSFQ